MDTLPGPARPGVADASLAKCSVTTVRIARHVLSALVIVLRFPHAAASDPGKEMRLGPGVESGTKWLRRVTLGGEGCIVPAGPARHRQAGCKQSGLFLYHGST